MSGDAISNASLKALGRRIESVRNDRGMSQAYLATKAGCSEKALRKLIKGQKTRGKVLAEVCKVLEIPLDDGRPVEISDLEHGNYPLNNFTEYLGQFFPTGARSHFPETFFGQHSRLAGTKKKNFFASANIKNTNLQKLVKLSIEAKLVMCSLAIDRGFYIF